MRRFVVIFALTACGGDGNGGGLFGDPELEGTWKEACAGRGSSELVVTGAELAWTHSYFRMDQCLGTVYAIRNDVERYAVGGHSSSSPDATEIDITSQSVTLMVTDQMMADSYNQSSYCGITDWAPNVPKDVLGKTCMNSGGQSMTYWQKGDVFYDIYKVDAAKLYFGNSMTGDGTTPATRPTMLATGYWSR